MQANNRTGETYTTNEGLEVEIIDYIGRHNVLIKFIERPDYQVWSTMQNILKGQVKFPYLRTVYGIGYYGEGKYTARVNGLKTPQYVKWFSMFNRCYDEKYHEAQPKYIGCSVSKEFHNYQNFAQWYDRKIYTCRYKLELDKDLLVEDNKIYSPSRCCLIPKEINNALNYKRHDKEYMTNIYNKYKNDIPYYVRDKLLGLTMYERRVG